MKSPFIGFFLIILFSCCVSAETPQEKYAFPDSEEGLPGAGPLRRYDSYMERWPEFRARWAGEAEQDKGAVVFLGDSITQGWGKDFKGLFPGMKLANRGIGGDTTRGMLVRLDDVTEVDPAAVVILMGTNDIEVGIEPEDIATNYGLILDALEKHDPDMPVVVCRVFPSSAEKDRPRDMIEQVNKSFAAIAKEHPQVTVLDTWALFAAEDGDADPLWFKDMLHLNPEGYKRWAASLKPVLATLGFTEKEAEPFESEVGFVSLFNGADLTGWGFRPTPPRKAPKKPRPDAPKFVEITDAENFDEKTESSDGRFQAINGRLVVTTPTEGRRIQQLWTTEEFPDDFILRLEFRATPNADSGVFIRKPQLQCRDFPRAGPYTELENFRDFDWNELEVVVKAGTARAACNGELLEEAMVVPETGPIGLEGDRGQIEYRNIRLKTLP